ncbi:MAG: hypothetical protein V3U75_01295 [Methylococcaceae bacterium]
MGHFVGQGERTYYVDEKGRTWDSQAKKVEYDSKTFETISIKGHTDIEDAVIVEDDDDSETKALKAIRRAELEGMKWPALRKLHASIVGSDERNLKKPAIIEGIITQEWEKGD